MGGGGGGSGGREVRWSWVNFQRRDALLIWIIVEQGPIALVIGAGGVLRTFLFSPIISLFFLRLLKYCLKRPLNPKTSNKIPMGLSIKGNNNFYAFEKHGDVPIYSRTSVG